jgi:inner membrane protein
MSDVPFLQAGLRRQGVSRSMGLKLLVVCILALVMTIPALFVSGLVDDRTQRAADVTKEISEHVGGQQTFLGPTLAIPYTIPAQTKDESTQRGIYLVFPAQASASARTATEERHRSLFKVPVFQADLQLDSAFDLTGVPAAIPPGATLNWDGAEVIVGVSDARGALADATLTKDGQAVTLAPAIKLALFGAKVGGLSMAGTKFSVSSRLKFSGAERLSVLAYGKSTRLAMQGDWASPGFDGGFLPVSRTVANDGFNARWSVPFIARGVRAEGPIDAFADLDATAMAVSFVEVADPYQSINRALKYVALFIGLVFLSYFVFEVTTGRRVHIAQYVLVGIAQLIFYLLLLAIAERVGFDFGFLVAGGATIALLSLNAVWVFESRVQGFRALGCFSLLYTLIYSLLRLEDNAMLVGALVSFAAVAAAMYVTRGIDWYASLEGKIGAGKQTPGSTA